MALVSSPPLHLQVASGVDQTHLPRDDPVRVALQIVSQALRSVPLILFLRLLRKNKEVIKISINTAIDAMAAAGNRITRTALESSSLKRCICSFLIIVTSGSFQLQPSPHPSAEQKTLGLLNKLLDIATQTLLIYVSRAILHHDATKTVPRIIYPDRRPTLRPSEQVESLIG